MRRVLSAYDSIIKTLGHHQALDYRIAVRLFNEKPALSITQADDLLATTQKALCDNTEVYKAYLTYHAQTNNPARLIEKYNQFKDAEPLSSATTSDIHAILIHALHDTGDMKEMVKVAGVLRDRNRLAMTTEECASMLMYLAQNDIKECENWWMYFSGTEITLPPSVYNVLVDAFAGAHKGVALHVLGHMQSKGVSPSEETFSYLLRMVDTDKNIRTFDRLLNKTLTKDACSALLTQCVRTGHLARANELRNFLLHRRGDFTFSITSLNCLLAAYARQGSINKGAALLKEMPERDTVTFEIAAHMYARAGDTRGCRDVVAEMHSQGLPFSAGVLLALMDLCVLHGDLEGCEKMFELMGKNGELTSVAFDKMITLYSNSGDLQKAREMWEKMEAQGVEPSTTTYNLIIQAHAKQGRSEECANFLEKMKARQLAPNLGTFAGILAANLQSRNLQGSRKYFEEMVKVIPVTSSAINAMLQYCSWKSSLKGEGFITKK